ncbi:MAG: hypothetical protein RQ754_04160 [Desulfuromonadales bacterium]|jgi:hypothetical protein|nr:hypothetical protein [Desulfuromonadales bacterium]
MEMLAASMDTQRTMSCARLGNRREIFSHFELLSVVVEITGEIDF